jgi:hypothetical protein
MYQHSSVMSAIAAQRRDNFIAAARHANHVRLATAGRGRTLRLRLRRRPRLTGLAVLPTSVPNATA